MHSNQHFTGNKDAMFSSILVILENDRLHHSIDESEIRNKYSLHSANVFSIDVITIPGSESTLPFKSNDGSNMAVISFFFQKGNETKEKKILLEFYQYTYVNMSKPVWRKTLFCFDQIVRLHE